MKPTGDAGLRVLPGGGDVPLLRLDNADPELLDELMERRAARCSRGCLHAR